MKKTYKVPLRRNNCHDPRVFELPPLPSPSDKPFDVVEVHSVRDVKEMQRYHEQWLELQLPRVRGD